MSYEKIAIQLPARSVCNQRAAGEQNSHKHQRKEKEE